MDNKFNDMFKMDFKTASPKQLRELFDRVDNYNMDDPTESFARAFTFGATHRAFESNGHAIRCDYKGSELSDIIIELEEEKGLALVPEKRAFVIMKGDIRKSEDGQISGLHGNEVSFYDREMNLSLKTIYHDDDSYEKQRFEDGQLKSTSFYDKDDNLLKKINKKGDAERRKTSDNIDELNEMAPSPLRQRLKRAMVKEFRQTRPKAKKGVEY